MQANHYVDFVAAQLGSPDDPTAILREIDLQFDPYGDNPYDDYESIRETVEQLDIRALLELETAKTQPDSFTVAQIGRTLRFQSPDKAGQLCALLLGADNLNAFRASWSTIMRGIIAIRSNQEYEEIFAEVDLLLDNVPQHSPHLLLPEANVLHYLKAIRFGRTEKRGQFVSHTYERTGSTTVRRSCIECWRFWHDRHHFVRLRNQWQNLGTEEQRMLWLAASNFGEEGGYALKQLRKWALQSWLLGVEDGNLEGFPVLYMNWCKKHAQ